MGGRIGGLGTIEPLKSDVVEVGSTASYVAVSDDCCPLRIRGFLLLSSCFLYMHHRLDSQGQGFPPASGQKLIQ